MYINIIITLDAFATTDFFSAVNVQTAPLSERFFPRGYLRRVYLYNVHKIYRYICSNVFVFFFTSFRNSPVVFFLHSFRFVSLFHPCNIIITICYYYYYYYSLLRARRFRRRANQFVSGFTRASSRHDFTVMSRPHCRYSKPEQFRAYNRI